MLVSEPRAFHLLLLLVQSPRQQKKLFYIFCMMPYNFISSYNFYYNKLAITDYSKATGHQLNYLGSMVMMSPRKKCWKPLMSLKRKCLKHLLLELVLQILQQDQHLGKSFYDCLFISSKKR